MRYFDDTMASVVRHETVRRSRGIEVLASAVTRQSRRAARRVPLWQRRGHAIPAGDNGDSPVRVGRPANDGFGSTLRSDKTAAPYAFFGTACRSWRCEDEGIGPTLQWLDDTLVPGAWPLARCFNHATASR